jgi:hypothetical protein
MCSARSGNGSPPAGTEPDPEARTRRVRQAHSMMRIAALLGIACATLSACKTDGPVDLEEEPEPAVEGTVAVDEVPEPNAKARFTPSGMEDESIDVETMDDGTYVVELTPGVRYDSFAFSAPGAFCPGHEFQAPDAVKTLDFDCSPIGGPVQVSYTPTANTCLQEVEPFTADYSLNTQVVGTQTLVDFVHTDAPAMSGEYIDESRKLTASTDWIDVGNSTEIRETIEVDLAFVIYPDGTIDSYWSLDGFSILVVRSTVTSASCSITSDLSVIPTQ